MSGPIKVNDYRDVSIFLNSIVPLNVTIESPDLYFQTIENEDIVHCCWLYRGLKQPAEIVKKVNKWIKRWANSNPFSVFVVSNRKTDEFLGYIGLNKKNKLIVTLFGCGHSYQWKEFGLEATIAITHYMQWIRDVLKVSVPPMIQAKAKRYNFLSRNILEKAGMILTVKDKEDYHYSCSTESKTNEEEDIL
ncbi:MAG TPA: GNAT family N-acetyltransferase [Rhabdochlamydiaceae bacterium]|nr:GNAT family N-acetyltransferase [Rhabdochlamydiaceae bacterium]